MHGPTQPKVIGVFFRISYLFTFPGLKEPLFCPETDLSVKGMQTNQCFWFITVGL